MSQYLKNLKVFLFDSKGIWDLKTPYPNPRTCKIRGFNWGKGTLKIEIYDFNLIYNKEVYWDEIRRPK
jgi:hypothetical protein